MKKVSKLISLILAFALAACAFGVVAYADGTPTVTVGSAQASAGETVKVDVVLSDCAQFSSYTIRVSYDSEYVTVVEAKKRVSKGIYQSNPSVGGNKELLIVGGDVDNITENGALATIEFKISEDYPGGVTEVPLIITQCKLTEYKNQKDIEFATQRVDGKLVISGAGTVIWNGGEGESEITPAKLTDEQAAEYKNPITNEGVSAGEYYINEESKIAIPAADVEAGVKNDPDTFKAVETEKPDETDEPASSGEDVAQGSEDIAPNDGGKLNWLLIFCICAGVGVVASGIFGIVHILKKKKADAPEKE